MCVRADSKQWSLVLAGAAGSKLNLSLLGATAMAALALGSWPLFCLALLVYVAFIGGAMLSPTAWRRAERAQLEAARRLPDPLTLRDGELRNAVSALQSTRRQVDQILAAVSKEHRYRYRPVLSWMDTLEATAAGLIRRADEIRAFLCTEEIEPLEVEIRRLSSRAEQVRDPDQLREYELARAALEQQLGALLEVTATREWLGAQLVRLVATAQSVPAKLMRLRVLEDARHSVLCDEQPGDLDWLDGEIACGVEALTSLDARWSRLDETERLLQARAAVQAPGAPSTT